MSKEIPLGGGVSGCERPGESHDAHGLRFVPASVRASCGFEWVVVIELVAWHRWGGHSENKTASLMNKAGGCSPPIFTINQQKHRGEICHGIQPMETFSARESVAFAVGSSSSSGSANLASTAASAFAFAAALASLRCASSVAIRRSRF